MADAVQLREFRTDLVASLDDCFEQLAWVGEVPVEGTKRQTRPSGRLLNRGKHRFLGEHFQHDVEHRIDVALPPGLPAVEHLGDVLGIRHRPSMVAMVLPCFVPSGSPGVQDLLPVVLAVACTWR